MDKAPVHLKPHSAAWFDGVMSVFELAPHHVHLLTLACDALDRGAQAREALSTNGITYIDARGFPKSSARGSHRKRCSSCLCTFTSRARS